MKSINARTALISLFLGLAVVTQAQAEDYYIYHDPDGKLVISNQEPPPGSKIIKQHSWPGITDSDVPQGLQPKNPQPNDQTEGSTKPSKEQFDRLPPRPYFHSVKSSVDCSPGRNPCRRIVGRNVEAESFWVAA